MEIRWITQKEANKFIIEHHRHHDKVIGSITQIGLFTENEMIGCAVISRPVSRMLDYQKITEVTRLCTNGIKNGCSMLYGSCARIAKEMGFKMIQTYILESESGTSLKASGWILADGLFGGEQWGGRVHINLFGELKRPLSRKKKYYKILKEKQ